MEEIIWDRTFRRAANVVYRKIAGEHFLVPIRGNLADMRRIFTLTPTGVFIWDRLDGAAPLSDLRDAVLDEFDTSREEAGADIAAFLEHLLEAGLAEAQG